MRLKIDPALQLVPDVIATRGRIESPHPVKALEVVVEILSETDAMSRTLTKCRACHSWGFEYIYVLDPDSRLVFRWEGHRLEEVDTLAGTQVQRLWDALDQQSQ